VSSKNKGRRGQQEVKALLHEHFPTLDDGDVDWRSMGAGGDDIILSPRAREEIGPLRFEVKYQESPPWEPGLTQAEEHVEDERDIPLYVRRRNYEDWVAVLYFEDLLRLSSIWGDADEETMAQLKELISKL